MVFSSHFTRWFGRPSKCAAPIQQPQVVLGADGTVQAPRAVTVVPGVEVAVQDTADGPVIRVKGEAPVQSAGALADRLQATAACRPALVTLNLSELCSISSLAMGVLVGFRRGVVRCGGQVRLAEELQPAVREALTRADVLDMFATHAAPALTSGVRG
jgi:anti-anti-sigma factor